ncbi:hypothetical protein WJ50_04385 [Burkholderia ubonensis]|nr:hypothetical protein WJ48_16350 [Burkholderia ubonensis]KVL68369.1 hypothetical protein WJ49_27440 [Burkholderia ubonensis]KVL96806.1 hypothetical protein WJ50_04385 [Burkholderia ubonensis]
MSQGTTNPGTRDLDKIYFSRVWDSQSLAHALTSYPANLHIVVPSTSTNFKSINWWQGDYVMIGSLPACEQDYYVIDDTKPSKTGK